MANKNPQLQHTILKYIDKIFNNSIDARLINALSQTDLQNYQTAINYYSEQFNLTKQDGASSLENKYFAAKSIVQLIKLLPSEKFEGVTQGQCEEFFKKLQK